MVRVKQDLIFPLEYRVNGASRVPIHLVGGIIVEVTGTSPAGRLVKCLQLMYISTAVTEIYMSLDACIKLGVGPENFLTIQDNMKV